MRSLTRCEAAFAALLGLAVTGFWLADNCQTLFQTCLALYVHQNIGDDLFSLICSRSSSDPSLHLAMSLDSPPRKSMGSTTSR